MHLKWLCYMMKNSSDMWWLTDVYAYSRDASIYKGIDIEVMLELDWHKNLVTYNLLCAKWYQKEWGYCVFDRIIAASNDCCLYVYLHIEI